MDIEFPFDGDDDDRTVATDLADVAESLLAVDTVEAIQDLCMDLVPRVLPSRAFGIYLFGDSPGRTPLAAAEGVSERFLTLYEELGRHQDPCCARSSNAAAPPTAVLMSENTWTESPFFRDVARLHDMRMVLEAPIIERGHVVGTLNFADNDRLALASPAEIAVAGALGRLVGVAVTEVARREAARAVQDDLWAALDLSSEATVILDLATGQRQVNAAARALLGRVGISEPTLWLTGLIEAGGPGRDADAGMRQTFVLDVRLDGVSRHLQVQSCVTDRGGARRVVALLELLPAAPGVAALPDHLASQLSAREREIAALAVAGLQDQQIAEKLFLSRYTVKQYLKTTYRKLGIRSRLELTRAALTGEPADDGPRPTTPEQP
ncbi:helix-turn-helix transcriptional regulator [Rhodococcus aetherivorans]|uniref:helix-turn-helix transcriptional regulator n=1 Tax=Rhodococcus aetherivorans TaxID=191292 RepID=UPI00241FFBDF|nr:LuxR C-terminal-related transcriptional regulator [Rhodococcus aetherivorans]WFS13567.1 LuxR C-terminal-related transcriptional regulator [Rhodococcus aetherivorans]